MRTNRYGGSGRKDANQDEIVKGLRAIGATVTIMDKPLDLLVGYRARNFLIECKQPGKAIKGLTPFQKEFLASWKGQVRVVETVDEAIKLVTESYGSMQQPIR